MSGSSVVAALRSRLRDRSQSARPAGTAKQAAVLVPLLGEGEQLDLVLFERSAELLEHKGEICFPGGSAEPQDTSPIETALREAHEELALPPAQVDVLGLLDAVPTNVSNYLITPVVGHVRGDAHLVPDRLEVARIIRVPLVRLLEPGVESSAESVYEGVRRLRYAYTFEGNRVWGATARILHSLLEIIR
jgi:8-oxo-dGTP pyrophosphatase MutT (NUDIX family)